MKIIPTFCCKILFCCYFLVWLNVLSPIFQKSALRCEGSLFLTGLNTIKIQLSSLFFTKCSGVQIAIICDVNSRINPNPTYNNPNRTLIKPQVKKKK
ncbi:MAG: hypothetical protein EAZ32_19470 [Cytophagia bacterium]|nr:MAG: hypothetical protein EAZ46_12485 [Runella sp.]TAG23980.1 MAG: hypothetical protein EAZ38_02110 [Cytophagales bacterium]TAG34672.1 MAG: hypothetical protein EAZ32_19470 [Cytophagia bacterium]TAG53461.1 MAG: hypothetical protein EAZ29_05640 [Runella slithyformis]TAG66450.1 MAG: hypothetical protein EAZ26_09665 [Runella slithyformis]